MKTNKWKMSAVAAFATAALLLGGCTNGNTPSPSPSQTSTTTTASASPTGSPTPSPTQASGTQANNGQQPNAATTNCAADSVQVPGSHGQYGEVDATFAPAVDALVASGTSREEANRQVLLAHAKNNVQRLAIWAFAAHLWADPNNTASLEKDGCLSSEGQALWQKLADAVGDASITMGDAPLGGTDSGVINNKYVVADHPGINGSTVAAIITLKNGVVIIVSEWCGNVIYMIVSPVVPKSPHITQHLMPQYVFVCDTVTKTDNVRVTVEEAANARYVAVGNIACKPQPPNVQRCDSKTKTDNVTISEEAAKDTDRYKPVNNIACHPVNVIKACIKSSGDQTLKPVDKFDDKTMSTNPADCAKPPCGCTPPPITRCDTHVWKIVPVTPEQAKDTARYTDISAEACKPPVDECVKANHPKPHPTDVWDQDHCKWIPCPPPVICPEGQTPNPNYPATSPDQCLNTKPADGDFHTNPGVAPVAADSQSSAPGLDHTTAETGGRGNTVIDTPTNTDATAPSGVTAPGADAPNSTPPTQVNEGGATDTNGTISGAVTSAPIDAPTVITSTAPAVVDQAAQQAAANQAAQDAADVAATQAARAQAQVVVVAQPQVATQQVATQAAASTTVAAQPAPTSAPAAATTAAGAPVMAAVTAPAANG